MKVRKSLVLLAILTGMAVTASAQLKEVGRMMAGGADEAAPLFAAYLKPFTAGMGHDLNAGWFNTAKTHKVLGVDLTFSMSMAFIPKSDKTFDASTLGLKGTASTGVSQTVAGSSDAGQTITYTQNGYTVAQYNMPQGAGLPFVPMIMPQIGLGLIKNTDVAVRFLPQITFGEAGKVKLWGVALKHDIKQWLPIADKVPFINIAIAGGYTRMKTSLGMTITPDMVNAVDGTTGQSATWENQSMDLTVSSFTISALASVDIPFITVFAGLGISNTKTELALKGNYPVPTLVGTTATVTDDAKSTVANPFTMTIKGSDGSPTKPRINGGLKLKLGFFHLFGEYTYANYSLVTAGMAISIR
jgi:hypothetical protein